MSKIIRRQTPTVLIGKVAIGSSHPVAVQAMTDTPTADVESTVRQTLELVESGAELVRWTVNDEAAALGAIDALKRLRVHGVTTPIIGDFHFNGHILLSRFEALAEGLDKYRINPGNVGGSVENDDHFGQIIALAVKYRKAVRIGVNWGSLDQALLARLMDENGRSRQPKSVREIMFDAMLESALSNANRAIQLGLPKEKLVISAKLSVLQDTVEVYERLAHACDYVLHLGLTEAGGGIKGITSSAAALAILLQQGIGDTIRVSLTPEPGVPRSREVEVCQEILQSLGFRYFISSVTSCPGCGRTKSHYFHELSRQVRQHVTCRMPEWRRKYPGAEEMKIAVMGCVVNGPGESRHADIGISLPGSFEDPVAPVYIEGVKVATLRGDKIGAEFIEMLEHYVETKYTKK